MDYILASKPMFNVFDTLTVHDPSVYSDHGVSSPTVSLEFERFTIESNEVLQFKFVWQSDKESDFVEKLTRDETVRKLDTVETMIVNCSNVNTDFVNDIVLEITNVFNDVASDMFSRKISHNIDSLKDNRINMSRYSEECEDRRYDILHLLNEYSQNDSNENRKRMVQARTLLKSCARKCRLNHDKYQIDCYLPNKIALKYIVTY